MSVAADRVRSCRSPQKETPFAMIGGTRRLDTAGSPVRLPEEGLPLREQALKAFQLRNEAKLAARELMADRAAAAALPPPPSIADSRAGSKCSNGTRPRMDSGSRGRVPIS